MATTLGQRCTVFLDFDGIQRFKIVSSIDSVLAGDLPLFGPSPFTSNVFVHKIVAPTDAKADTFLRVANVADLTTLAQGREQAVGFGQMLYLTTSFSVTYDDIATATTAKTLIQQRVDNLIADWHTYNEKFLAPLTSPPDLSVIPLPLTLSEETARKEAYNEAHAELLVAKGVTAAAAATAAATLTAATAANQTSVNAVDASQLCSTRLGQFNSGNFALNTYRSAVNNFRAASVTYANATTTFVAAADVYRAISGDPNVGQEATYDAAKALYVTAKSNYDAAVTAMTNASTVEIAETQAVFTALNTAMATDCTTKISDVGVAVGKKTAADKAAADATTAKKAADADQAAALLADTAAFLSVKELCPDFEPTIP